MADLPDTTLSDTIRLDLPLSPRHASTVRMVAASLAADAGFNVDEIDDLRLGINEAVSVVTDVDAPDGARLIVVFDVNPERGVHVDVTRTLVAPLSDVDGPDDLARRILSAVVDRFSVTNGTFSLTKSRAVAEGR